MNDDVTTRLEQRIAKLEVANRRWMRFAVCAAIGLAGLGMMGAQKTNNIKADQIEAQRIIVRDPRRRTDHPGEGRQLPGDADTVSG